MPLGYEGRLVTPEQRAEAFRKMVAQRPDEPFPRYSLAMCHRSAGQLDDAAREFQELIRRCPDYVPTYLMLGQVLVSLGRAAEAVGVLERGVAAASQADQQHARSEMQQALELLQAQGVR